MPLHDVAGYDRPEPGGFHVWSPGMPMAPATIEGGDVLVLGGGSVLVGMSERTQPQAVEMLAQTLFAQYGWRPVNKAVAAKFSSKYPDRPGIFTVDDKTIRILDANAILDAESLRALRAADATS